MCGSARRLRHQVIQPVFGLQDVEAAVDSVGHEDRVVGVAQDIVDLGGGLARGRLRDPGRTVPCPLVRREGAGIRYERTEEACMRRAIIPALLALMLAALATAPATAGESETRIVIPFSFTFGPVFNPCTETFTDLQVTGEWDLHALPSIESFIAGEFKHANVKLTGEAVGLDDGYATAWKPFQTTVINQGADHYVEAKAENLMFDGNDGGKYRVHTTLRLVVVDGEAKVESDLTEAFCVQQPNS